MKESDIQSAIMTTLGAHPRVVWVMVVTTGKFRVKGGFITTGHYITDDQKRLTGMSDIIGMMTNGAFLAIETKRPGEKPTNEQHAFLELVSRINIIEERGDS
jgi:hypothetical protein